MNNLTILIGAIAVATVAAVGISIYIVATETKRFFDLMAGSEQDDDNARL